MKTSAFDRNRLEILPINEREHDLSIKAIKNLPDAPQENIPEDITEVAKRVIRAQQKDGAITLMFGAHVIRSGVQRYIIDLMERGYISCLATNGAGVIHDFEFALIGATTESVAKYIADGRFGMWKETGTINDIINEAYHNNSNSGLGESVGRAISKGEYPYKESSVFAAASRLGIPATVHVGIGCDIIHQLPNCNGAATGQLSYNDFLILAEIFCNLENGVVMNFGSAVMAPEVFLKALSMARNLARQKNKTIKHFTTLVSDLQNIQFKDKHEPSKNCSTYYFRPLKTMLIRTVADGGKSFFVRGDHAETVPQLWSAIINEEKRQQSENLST